ncbi:MAG: PIG-L family deacetylase [Rudaea sp.]|nr:PIG-L family deacetylase [Rudaea sp.]
MGANVDDRRAPIRQDGLDLRNHDRVLVFAPHPDDESIASGGLLQIARSVGAAVRVVVLTDGDNNPWPQRWVEKRWRIGNAERARWGARRREEARAAMSILGVAQHDTSFLGLPDLGLTELLMRADAQVIESLRGHIDEFKPSLLVLPALSDRHPDHSATHIFSRLALGQCKASMPQLLPFAVHGKTPGESLISVGLSAAQRDIKQAAILAHASQMQLSQRRFLRYAANVESYLLVPPQPVANPHHPLQAGVDRQGVLHVRIDLKNCGSLRSQDLFCAIESADAGSLRWQVPLDLRSTQTEVRLTAGAVGAAATWRRERGNVTVSLISPGLAGLRQGYAKLARAQPGWRVFDRFGWQPVVRS